MQKKEIFRRLSFVPISIEVRDHAALATPHAFFRGEDAVLQFCAATPGANTANQIEFSDCKRMRIGDPNDEGFYSDGIERYNSSIYNAVNFPNLEFYQGFFEVFGTSIDELESLHEGLIRNPCNFYSDPQKTRHFLFFMKDATFECFAAGYEEIGLVPLSSLKANTAEFT
ncbi:MAG: hypothetical protein K5905_21510 [Roseibium sp.]|uniref:hypothetical protein n=1 Tax=Roseibium sp. TaxID=1936156 RepID=UPI0026080D89|nr:hypothetical protein [Roseibium sp.]MCV0428042.1 hypothetical protein [Roseibium sp.]